MRLVKNNLSTLKEENINKKSPLKRASLNEMVRLVKNNLSTLKEGNINKKSPLKRAS